MSFGLLLCCRYLTARPSGYIHPMKEEEDDIIVNLVKNNGKFETPKNSRTNVHKSAYVKYWRLKGDLTLNDDDLLFFNGKRVLKKTELGLVVAKAFKKTNLVVTKN